MLAIRLQRTGSNKRPFFRIVVIEAKAARDSRVVETLGHYNPRAQPERIAIDYERVARWVKDGARLSDTVRTLLRRHPAPHVTAETSAAPETSAT